jgi:hypothetical protein
MDSLLPVIVGLAAGIAMIVSFAVFMPSSPSLQIFASGRVWMALDIGQCAHPWDSFRQPDITGNDAMRQYFLVEHDLTIYEANSIASPKLDDPTFPGYLPCMACGCYGGTIEALINWEEMHKARELGFYEFERSSSTENVDAGGSVTDTLVFGEELIPEVTDSDPSVFRPDESDAELNDDVYQ